MAPPEWALLERAVIDQQTAACEAFFSRYFDSISLFDHAAKMRVYNPSTQLRLGGIGIQGVVLGRVDRLLEHLAAGGIFFFGGVVGDGQQIVALDFAFGVERHAILVKQLLGGARTLQAFEVAIQ